MSLVAFTPRAERALVNWLGDLASLHERLLVVDVSGDEVRLVLEDLHALHNLQQDVEVVGPFRVQLLGEETTVFVRGPEHAPAGVYELDYEPSVGRLRVQISA